MLYFFARKLFAKCKIKFLDELVLHWGLPLAFAPEEAETPQAQFSYF